MLDSYDSAVIPLGSDVQLRDRYMTHLGGVRIGRLLEDMDIFAVHLVFKHTLLPSVPDDVIVNTGAVIVKQSPFSIVTALVDRIFVNGEIRPDEDIKVSGHVTWVGRSSAESTLVLEQKRDDGHWQQVTEASFVLVARDPLNTKGAVLNPLIAETDEEKELLAKGEKNKMARKDTAKDSLFKNPPTEHEKILIHDFFMKTVDHTALSFKARIKPANSIWMEDGKLKNLVICQPENRNRFNKIFGGFIMRQAFELAWASAYVFSKERPYIKYMDDISFEAPVEVGSLLYFNSQVIFTF
jgi:acyl-coenzyme A thioesterase 9